MYIYYFCSIISQSGMLNPLRKRALESSKRVTYVFLPSPYCPPSLSPRNGSWVFNEILCKFNEWIDDNKPTNLIQAIEGSGGRPRAPAFSSFIISTYLGSWAEESEVWSLKVIFTRSFEVLMVVMFISQ